MLANLLTGCKAFNLVLLAFQSSIVGIYASVPAKSDNALAEVVHLVAVIGLVILSPREHHRSVSPSKYSVIYLSTRTFLNLTTLLLVHDRGFIIIQVLRTTIEAGNLIAESQNKGHFLLEPFLDIAPEETAGPWSRASFAWVASICFRGKDHSFSLGTLPRNPRRFDPSEMRQKILLAWDQRGKPITCIQCIKLTNFPSEARKCFDTAIHLGALSHARLCYCCIHTVYAHRLPLRSTTPHK